MRKGSTILIAEDEERMRQGLHEMFEEEGFTVSTAIDGNEAAKKLEQKSYDLIITDLKMPGKNGMELLKIVKQTNPDIPVIMITGYGTIETAVEAMKLGAYDYITKPFNLEEVKIVIEKALHYRKLSKEITYLRQQVETASVLTLIIGESEQIRQVLNLAKRVAQTDSTVLITGESGTGKELVAKAIHSLSPRKDEHFVPVSCAGLKESLLESELFGHVKGAFTGAIANKQGLFEIASGGTFFFDEIAETTAPVQAKLLRVLQEREFLRLGDTKVITTDVRVIAATNKDLEICIKEGSFREDLYYRLNVVSIKLPPLRARMEDVPLLAKHFLKIFNEKMSREIIDISPEAMNALMEYEWPGNIRELQNAIERAVVLEKGNTISLSGLPEKLLSPPTSRERPTSETMYKKAKEETLNAFNKDFITQILSRHKGNISKAAQAANMDRPNLYRLMKKYGINPKDF